MYQGEKFYIINKIYCEMVVSVGSKAQKFLKTNTHL